METDPAFHSISPVAGRSAFVTGPKISGTATVKAEFLVQQEARPGPDDDAAESSTSHLPGLHPGSSPRLGADETKSLDTTEGEPPQKKIRLSEPDRAPSAKEGGKNQKKKKERGMNTRRKFTKVREDVDLCHLVAVGKPCDRGDECKFTHDITAYLAAKPADIHFPPVELSPLDGVSPTATEIPSLDPTTKCPVFEDSGLCRHGYKCRFLGGHATIVHASEGTKVELVTDNSKWNSRETAITEMNSVAIETLKMVRSKKYPTPVSDNFIKEQETQKVEGQGKSVPTGQASTDDLTSAEAQKDTPDVQIRPQEKKRLNWKGMRYLAPLTTVGNLPYRRLCVDFGAEITCNEMSLAQALLNGNKDEWSLVRRYPSEKVFGVQIAGNRPGPLAKTAEILKNELGRTGEKAGASGIDFVDLNCGCPIDMVYKNGAGSALLDQAGRLGKILNGMNRALGDIPLTIKVRTGVKEGKNTVHKFMPRLSGWNVGAVTIHGRTRQQRYSKLADWPYIKQCVDSLKESMAQEEDDLLPIPIFGGGDVFTAQQYYQNIEETGVDGIMIGRGALIKPWIFTEIQEHREWDISSRERLDMIRKYAEYGLSHWGSDSVGVNTTRRFLCEALSFQYRYIPLGILESVPRINDRAPAFRCRDELETLLASPSSNDWVKISEMFLGKVPEGWSFMPKHKSSAQGSEEGNG